MKFFIEYTQNNADCLMEVEAADLNTCRIFANQWRVNKLKNRKDKIKITDIYEKP
jgi:hypothetical protein